jgi:flagellar basal body-associated protein FliL
VSHPPTYQPQGGNWAAPPYGNPPPKNRAGLIILLIVVLVAAILGIVGFVAFRLTSGGSDGGTAPAGPLTSTQATTAPSKAPTKAVPSKPAPTKPAPSKPVASNPAAGTNQAAFALASRFATELNGDHTDAAVAMSCADTKSTMPTLISVWIGAPTNLTVSEAVIGQNPYFARFTGTTKGHQVTGMIIIQDSCVKLFQLSQS